MQIEYNGQTIDLVPTKIIAVARNYRAHAAEMAAAAPEEPKFFLKPPSSLLPHQGIVRLPGVSARVDWEVELAVVIKDRIRDVAAADALGHVLGYSVIVDITARDIQNEAKKTGMPWAIAKGFDTFAPLGPRIVPADRLSPDNLPIWLKQNGGFKQQGNTQAMIHSVPHLIAYISSIMTLEPMDIIATGTPEGIGPMKHGDLIEAGIDGIGTLSFTVESGR